MTAALARFAPPDAPSLPDDLSTERRFRRLAASRRVAVGPNLSLVFENRETLWFRLAELGSAARLTSAAKVRRALDWYNRLLPADGTLRAAVWLGTPARLAFADAAGRGVPGRFRPDPAGGSLTGWAEFPFTPADIDAFSAPGRGWHLTAEVAGAAYASEALSDDCWRSLQADLA